MDVTPIDVLAFVCEMAMLALLSVAGWRLGPTTLLSVVLAVALPGVAILIWSQWMARTSRRRLRRPPRLAAEIALFVAAGATAAAAGLPWWGATFAVVASATFALARDA
ncbi:conserved hypothetical protein [Beutenbergia cavernae DSM 12333]|uniref:Integral membrane protein n=1 Tax=Beutenbergia cavernae (strain ATCC BAA-8 / DSM 12333 / CCUG 43141 / JCM 11478 / NBRC 16432 / NCIMB 13614 / HKI 0122) TaxID=471853 RepID=C5C2U4_BEUC1|nr:conserved hypothetical protein [Beutenbergia cavernae DSM 12333]